MPVADSAASESIAPGGFALHCRGDVRLYCGDSDCTPRSKKGRALLAILAAEQRPLSRVKIIDLLWSDRQEEQARASLRTLLAEMRQQFNSRFDELLAVERERIALGAGVRTDLTDPALARPAGELFEGLDHIDPELDEWLRMEREKWAKALPRARPPAHEPGTSTERRLGRRTLVAVLLAAILLLGGLYAWRQSPARAGPVLAVLKFRDVSGQNQHLADGLAEQLRIELQQNPALKVISSASSESPTVTAADLRLKADLLGATHLIEGVIVPHDGLNQLSLRLVDVTRREALWSTSVPATGPAMLLGKDPVAPQIAAIIGEVARDPVDRRGMAADERAYADYFRAVSLARGTERRSLEQAQRLLESAISRYPDFAPALAALARITMRLSDQTLLGIGSIPAERARELARRLADRAIAAAPNYAPAYSARGLADYGLKSGLEYYRHAVRLGPGSATARSDWAEAMALLHIGTAADRLVHVREAARLDPLNGPLQFRLVEELILAGHADEGRAALRQYAARDIPEDRRHESIARAELIMFGDWSNAFVEAALAKRANPENTESDYLLMWSKLLLYGHAAAAPHAKPGSMTHLMLTDDLDGLIRHLRRLGSEYWRSNYEIMAVGHYLNSRGRSDVIVGMMDEEMAKGAPLRMFLYPDVIAALKEHGRHREADFLIAQGRKTFGNLKGEEALRTAHKVAVLQAQSGDIEGAIRNLRIAHGRNWWGVSDILDHPYALYVYKPLRKDRRFQQLVRDYDRWVDKERREARTRSAALKLPPPPDSPPPPMPPMS